MSAVSLTHAERVKALQRLEYTEREAKFLCLAALHGGFFLHRQYSHFSGKEIGGITAALVEKLLANNHAEAFTGWKNTQVYHLASRPFYALLGEQDNRNRRQRPPRAIKNKLMGLDFVLEFPEREFLATEQEKVEYFTTQRSIKLSDLPSKKFTSQQTGAITERFFIDKYPLFLSNPDPESEERLVMFCFVDEGLSSGSRFETYLNQYKRLFKALRRFHLIYVAASEKMFRLSARTFVRFFRETSSGCESESNQSISQSMTQHFEDRRLFESNELESFDRAKLIRFRNDRERFSGTEYEALFQSWKRPAGVHPVGKPDPQENVAHQLNGTFSQHLLPYNYDVFGSAFYGAPRALGRRERAATAENIIP